MVKKTYRLRKEDQEYLVSLASRFHAIRTKIDEALATMTVWTTFAKDEEPTSFATQFKLELVSNEPPPRESPDEFRWRAFGNS